MKKSLFSIIFMTALLFTSGCNNQNSVTSESSDGSSSSLISSSSSKSSESSISSSSSQSFKENELSTEDGLTVKFSAKGARIEKITWDNKQIAKDGFTVGRCANRIAKGKFTLNGVQYSLTINNNGNHLHGGGNSWQGPFANATWTKLEQTDSSISFSIHSADGEEGYPGNFDMTVKYTLSQEGELSIEYFAKSDKDTLCNPTNHLFMSLNGNNSDANHSLWIDADGYTKLNSSSIPTGEIVSVENTKFDYRTERAFDNKQSYDDNYVLNGEGYRKVATMTGNTLGVKVDVYTDRPGLQLYRDGSGNICLETQMFPDAINHPEFEDPILRANEDFYSKTTYAFSKVK